MKENIFGLYIFLCINNKIGMMMMMNKNPLKKRRLSVLSCLAPCRIVSASVCVRVCLSE